MICVDGVAVPKYFERDCIYEEALECYINGRTKFKETFNQINSYKEEKFPMKFGLGENNIILRNHTKKNVRELMESWWHEMNTQTTRDQLSLGYVLWKSNIKFCYDG